MISANVTAICDPAQVEAVFVPGGKDRPGFASLTLGLAVIAVHGASEADAVIAAAQQAKRLLAEHGL